MSKRELPERCARVIVKEMHRENALVRVVRESESEFERVSTVLSFGNFV